MPCSLLVRVPRIVIVAQRHADNKEADLEGVRMNDTDRDSPEKESSQWLESLKYATLGYFILLAVSLVGYHYGFWIHSTRSHLFHVLLGGPVVLGILYGIHWMLMGSTGRKKFLTVVTLMIGFPLWFIFKNVFRKFFGLGSGFIAVISIFSAYPIAVATAELWGGGVTIGSARSNEYIISLTRTLNKRGGRREWAQKSSNAPYFINLTRLQKFTFFVKITSTHLIWRGRVLIGRARLGTLRILIVTQDVEPVYAFEVGVSRN